MPPGPKSMSTFVPILACRAVHLCAYAVIASFKRLAFTAQSTSLPATLTHDCRIPRCMGPRLIAATARRAVGFLALAANEGDVSSSDSSWEPACEHWFWLGHYFLRERPNV